MTALIVSTKTGEKTCITPIFEHLGIAEGWVRDLLLETTLFASFIIPLSLTWYFIHIWKVSKKKRNM